MKKFWGILILAALAASLVACDIEAVSVGLWNIEMDTPEGRQTSVWTIAADGKINMSGDTVTVTGDAILEGSRIFWSGQTPETSDASAAMMNINFSGTVDGDSMQGTIFTTLGNYSVTGIRP